MATRQIADKRLQCASCGDHFVFTAGEQEFFLLRGVMRQPERCPSCRRPQSGRFHAPVARG
jgi:hypothetical protein